MFMEAIQEEETMQTGLRLPVELYRRIKRAAIDIPCTASELVKRGMEEYMKKLEEK